MNRSGRLFLWLAGAALAVGAAGGAAGWRYCNSRPDRQLRRADAALSRGDWPEAEQGALRLEAEGHKDEAAFLRGKAHLAQARPALEGNQPQAVTELLTKALLEFNRIQTRDAGPLHLDAAALTGQCLFFLKDYAQAARILHYVLDHRQDCPDAHRFLAAVYFDQGALLDAIRHAEAWAALDPRDGRPYCLIGTVCMDLEQKTEAIHAFRAALGRELGPTHEEQAKEGLAELLVRTSRYDEALRVLEDCEPRRDDKAKVHALRAECLVGLRRQSEARALLDQAPGLMAFSPVLLRLRAQIHLDEEEFAAAAPLLVQALALDAHDYASRHLLAQTYERLGRRADAIEQRRRLEETRKLFGELSDLNRQAMSNEGRWDQSLRLRLAEVAEKLGKLGMARDWRAAAARCPAGPEETTPEGRPRFPQ